MTATLDETDTLSPNYDQNGLIAVLAQDASTREVLMLAWMNAEALQKTRETGEAHYWSRSRSELWHKGKTSGNIQRVREIRIDCDQDAVLLLVDQTGNGACHTGRRSCFYRILGDSNTSRLTFGNVPDGDIFSKILNKFSEYLKRA